MKSRQYILLLIFLCLAALPVGAAGEDNLLSQGIAAYKAGKFDEAVTYLSQYRQQNPPSVEACRYQALALNSLGKNDEALAEVEGGLTRHPRDVSLIITQGKVLANLGRYPEAEAAFSRAIKLDPQQGETWKERGAIRAKMNKLKEAAKDFDQGAQLSSEDPEIFVQRGLIKMTQGRFKAAEQDFQTAIKLRPDLPEAYFHRGNLYFYHLQDRKKALADYQEACRLGHSSSCLQLKKLKAEMDQAQDAASKAGKGQKDVELFGEGLGDGDKGDANSEQMNLKLPDGEAGPGIGIALPKTKKPKNTLTLENTIYPLLRGIPYPLVLLIFLGFLCLMEGIKLAFSDKDRRHQRRLKKRLKFIEDLRTRGPVAESLLKVNNLSGIPLLHQTLKRLKRLEQVQTLLAQAGVSWSVGHFLLLSLLLGGVGLCLGFYKFGPLGATIGGCLGAVIPTNILKFKKRQRVKKFEKQLPEGLDLMARGLKAGHAFASGMQLVATEMENPIGIEFFKTFKEYNHGMDLNTALLNLCHRMDLRDLRYFTTAVMIQRETGGNLTEILEKIANLIRERFKLRNQIKALTAEGRLSGWILCLMPPAVALLLFRINPDYIMMLYTHPLGRMMAVMALMFQLLGMLCIRKIVSIKV